MDNLVFPDGFLWGTATSSHQVEGGNDNNDWWDWEQTPGHIRDGSTSRLACDHYHRYRGDWAMAHDLGQNAHRLSIEWSRVEPQEGTWDDDAIAHYRDVLASMRSAGSSRWSRCITSPTLAGLSPRADGRILLQCASFRPTSSAWSARFRSSVASG